MDKIYEDINPYFDDIVLGSPTVEEHCRLLHRTLLKTRKANLKFNVLKTQLSQTSVNYLGHVLSDEGIKPDPKKIRAIEEFATPNCKADLQRFLGMVTYLAKFTPHLSNLTNNLRQLLKKDSVWIWDTNTERDFKLVKQTIMKYPCLKYFNGNKAVTASVDASKNGLGAVLLQEGQPVAYGSVSLTQTQQRYAQIEKELMAVIYGLEHFNYIILMEGLSLSRQIISQYLALLECVPGKNLVIADALSRAQSTTDNFDEVLDQEATVRINLLTQASPTKWEEIASLTAGDPEMQDVLFHINNGVNGQIERAVQTVKNSLTKAAEEGKDLYVVLLDYIIQPAKDMPSPAELLMGRKLRTFLPSHPGQLKPTFDVERAREALRKMQII
ncbi:retrovirus-related Pol polyprotein from transposon 17.6 [Trichonephila inaurata madagascariensis]|uniref:Retrovirus-related Pol polyprotein from transposon 17.6 n=1 Tax=Trichonephila inaurata madagascariensis TaxID=2747483 RepID=A0A8X7CBS6_9ARAC|nr:retrovirus-related Pol polyprotein from transposon 17.6 [Trichonephila inaurata madagascariensis]